jgi:hypothetical protein
VDLPVPTDRRDQLVLAVDQPSMSSMRSSVNSARDSMNAPVRLSRIASCKHDCSVSV